MADGTGRATASGEQMGDNVRQVLAEHGVLRAGDVSVDWVIVAHVNAIDDHGRLQRRPVVLCMRDLDPDEQRSLIELATPQARQPLL